MRNGARRLAYLAVCAALIGLSTTAANAIVDDVAFGRLSLEDLAGPRETAAAPSAVDLTVLKQAIDLYRRGDMLVNVVREQEDTVRLTSTTTLRGVAGSPKIIPLSDAGVGCMLTKNIQFFRWKADKHGEFISVPDHPPDWLIKAVATRKYLSLIHI